MTDIHHAPPEGARGYPRLQLFRDTWTSLDGTWGFAVDRDARWRLPTDVAWEGTFTYPAPPRPAPVAWQRRRSSAPAGTAATW